MQQYWERWGRLDDWTEQHACFHWALTVVEDLSSQWAFTIDSQNQSGNQRGCRRQRYASKEALVESSNIFWDPLPPHLSKTGEGQLSESPTLCSLPRDSAAIGQLCRRLRASRVWLPSQSVSTLRQLSLKMHRFLFISALWSYYCSIFLTQTRHFTKPVSRVDKSLNATGKTVTEACPVTVTSHLLSSPGID